MHCNVIPQAKDSDNDADIMISIRIIEPLGYIINIIPDNVLYQIVTKDRIENIEVGVKDDYCKSPNFIGDILGFTLHLL